VLAVLAGLLVVPGLLGGKDGSGRLNPIAEAAENTSSWPGARTSMQASVAGLPGGAAMSMDGHGVFSGETERSEITIGVRSTGLPGAGSFEMTSIGDGDDFYMHSELFAAGLPDGKSWMLLRDLAGGSGSQGSSAGQGDPREQLRYLRSVSDAITLVGKEPIRGTPTSHYVASVDMEREVERLRSEGADEAVDALEQSIELVGGSEQRVEVWIDGKNLIRRMAMGLPFELAGQGGRLAMTMDFFDFGIHPEIALPPESLVFDATDLAEDALEQLSDG
jgi:hypothetical protein